MGTVMFSHKRQRNEQEFRYNTFSRRYRANITITEHMIAFGFCSSVGTLVFPDHQGPVLGGQNIYKPGNAQVAWVPVCLCYRFRVE